MAGSPCVRVVAAREVGALPQRAKEAEERFRKAFRIGGRTVRDGELADSEIHPIPEDEVLPGARDLDSDRGGRGRGRGGRLGEGFC